MRVHDVFTAKALTLTLFQRERELTKSGVKPRQSKLRVYGSFDPARRFDEALAPKFERQ